MIRSSTVIQYHPTSVIATASPQRWLHPPQYSPQMKWSPTTQIERSQKSPQSRIMKAWWNCGARWRRTTHRSHPGEEEGHTATLESYIQPLSTQLWHQEPRLSSCPIQANSTSHRGKKRHLGKSPPQLFGISKRIQRMDKLRACREKTNRGGRQKNNSRWSIRTQSRTSPIFGSGTLSHTSSRSTGRWRTKTSSEIARSCRRSGTRTGLSRNWCNRSIKSNNLRMMEGKRLQTKISSIQFTHSCITWAYSTMTGTSGTISNGTRKPGQTSRHTSSQCSKSKRGSRNRQHARGNTMAWIT